MSHLIAIKSYRANDKELLICQDAVSEKQEFEVFDDQNLNILAVGDLGK